MQTIKLENQEDVKSMVVQVMKEQIALLEEKVRSFGYESILDMETYGFSIEKKTHKKIRTYYMVKGKFRRKLLSFKYE